MSTLILTLPAAPVQASTAYRYTLTSDGHQASRQGEATAALLPDPGRAGETVAIVAQQQLSWQRVTLPPGALAHKTRLRAVLEGLLEEHVLDEPAALHFALPPDAAAGVPLWIAVCDRAWLHEALQALEAAGRRVDRVVPDAAPGATASGQVEGTVVGAPEQPQVLLSGLGPTQAVALYPLHSPALRDGLLGAEAAILQAEPAVLGLAEQFFGRSVPVLTSAQRDLAAAHSRWDLAQFDLARTGHQQGLRRLGHAAGQWLRAPQWRAARWALGLGVVLQIGALNLWAWQDARQLAAVQAAVQGALTQTFPQVKLVIDAPLQMEREVAGLRQQTGALSSQDLEPLLASVASALPSTATPTRLDYADGGLRLSGLVLTPEQRVTFLERLAGHSLRVQEQDGALLLRPSEATP